MTYSFRFGVPLVLAIASLVFVGCEPSGPGDAAVVPVSPPGAEGEGHDHEHASKGPHGGAIIELGTEAHHAELVHDESGGTVSVYILDAAATAAVPIDATEVVINLTHEGTAEQFELAASPDANDPAGSSSRFVSSEAELGEELDHAHGEATLVVTIEGKQYRGALAHDHDHEGHAH